MRTIREWLNELPDKERAKAFKYEKPEWDYSKSTMYEAMYWAFIWSETKEGYEYWAEIATRYK